MTGLYIHIPFCVQKCAYCDFNSYAGKLDLQRKYAKRLIEEIQEKDKTEIDTIYIGGGTPTVLDAEVLLSVLENAKSHFSLSEDAEITVEVNPGMVTEEKLKSLYHAGVNRLSIGMQSASDDELSILGRIHSAKEAEEAFYMARKAGFSNINIDIMYGTPDQTMESWLHTLHTVLKLNPEHISAYSLILEENTPFWYQDLKFPDEDTERKMHWEAIRLLKEHGYQHYEISNFAKEGKESRHNIKYWTMEPYIGVGAGAHSFYNNRRTANVEAIEDYIEKDKICIADYAPSLEELENERMMLGFRMIDGVYMGCGHEEVIRELAREGLVLIDGSKARLTERGLDLANQVFMEFV